MFVAAYDSPAEAMGIGGGCSPSSVPRRVEAHEWRAFDGLAGEEKQCARAHVPVLYPIVSSEGLFEVKSGKD